MTTYLRFTAAQHSAATYRQCRRPLENEKVGCGGQVGWENDAHFPIAYFGFTGTCLLCGHKVHTQELLAPSEPLALVRNPATYDRDRQVERARARWNRLMEEIDAT